MTIHSEVGSRQRRVMTTVKAYPLGVLLIGIALNLFVFGVNTVSVALPSIDCIRALVVAGILLVLNHTWLMATTELTRVRFNMHASPEEWAASGTTSQDASAEGVVELERRHNIHRNTTENTVYFILLSLVLVVISPTSAAAQAWIVGFPVARLGYTYSYLLGRTGLRGLFMSLSLLAMYGIASYLAISLFV